MTPRVFCLIAFGLFLLGMLYIYRTSEERNLPCYDLTPDIQRKIQHLHIEQKRKLFPSDSDTLFTGTLCLSCRGDRYLKFRQAILSILKHHTVEELKTLDYLVINETSEEDAISKEDTYLPLLAKEFSFINFIQKTSSEKGQARSLNMILSLLPQYKYWIHWEETWITVAPFLQEARYVMDHSPLDQLQLTNDWIPTLPKKRKSLLLHTPHNRSVYRLREHPNIRKNIKNKRQPHGQYPLYSLRPSINRCSFFKSCGKFNEDPARWPWKFEWDFGNIFYQQGGTKGACDPPFAFRQPYHTSTYNWFLSNWADII